MGDVTHNRKGAGHGGGREVGGAGDERRHRARSMRSLPELSRPGNLDIYVPHDQVQARIAAALAAGGTIVSDANAPQWWTLADPEGNEADLAIWG
jgi:hypothetical protein